MSLSITDVIPNEILLNVAYFLDERSLVRLSGCNKQLRVLCTDNALWERLHGQLKLPISEQLYIDQIKHFYSRFIQFVSLFNPEIKGNPSILKTKAFYERFISHNRDLSDDQRKQLLGLAVKRGFLDIAFHLHRIKFSRAGNNKMLVCAWHHGAKEMALEILRDRKAHVWYEYGDEKDDSNLHWRAVYYQQPECLQLLLARLPIGEGLRNELVLQCFNASSRQGPSGASEEMIVELLKVILRQSISQKTRMQAIDAAKNSGKLAAVEVLLRNGALPEQECDIKLLYDAASKNDPASFKKLLGKDCIAEIYLDQMVERAMNEDRPDLIEFLLNYGSISETLRGQVVFCYTKLGNTNLVERLLRNGPISLIDCSMAMNCAEEQNLQDLLEMLDECYIDIDYRYACYGDSVMKLYKKRCLEDSDEV